MVINGKFENSNMKINFQRYIFIKRHTIKLLVLPSTAHHHAGSFSLPSVHKSRNLYVAATILNYNYVYPQLETFGLPQFRLFTWTWQGATRTLSLSQERDGAVYQSITPCRRWLVTRMTGVFETDCTLKRIMPRHRFVRIYLEACILVQCVGLMARRLARGNNFWCQWFQHK